MSYIFDPAPQPSVAIQGSEDLYPVHRIYCVGRNYAAHAREMGRDPDREPPFFFMKPADAVVADGSDIPYAKATENLHYEMELVVAIARPCEDIGPDAAKEHIFGYAAGIDLTRRDLQLAAREKGRPWDTGKGFDRSAPCGAIRPAGQVEDPDHGAIWLKVNGEVKQSADIADMIWSVPEIVAELSRLYRLMPGDLIYTGTPAGVGPLKPGDRVEGAVEGIGGIHIGIV